MDFLRMQAAGAVAATDVDAVRDGLAALAGAVAEVAERTDAVGAWRLLTDVERSVRELDGDGAGALQAVRDRLG